MRSLVGLVFSIVVMAGVIAPRGALAAASQRPGAADVVAPEPRTVTFTKDIAPILFDQCATCHRPGLLAPFSLLSYQDAAERARQIARVTTRRYMPPWLPEPGYGAFVGERRLRDDQIDLIQQWAEAGAPEGDPSDLPPAPHWPAGWQLGEPDLVVTMPQPYTLRAEGEEVYRNFVIPIPVASTRYVKGVEFQPGNRRIVHHARLLIDRTDASRNLDAQDPDPGYDGMLIDQAQFPDGHFLGYAPGRVPSWAPAALAWRLESGTDLVLQAHMLPSGQPEVLQARVGFFFADQPPTKTPLVVQLESKAIDIPAGKNDHVVTDTYELPVDVDALSVYPHAHYLGKDMKVWATLPDGTRTWLIWIRDWDFNWQDEYRFAEPIFLPKGTTLTMQYTYDNSADNPRNPNDPPTRIVYGPRSSDEMAELSVQVLPRGADELAILRRDFARKALAVDIAGFEKMLREHLNDAGIHRSLAASYLQIGKVGDATRHARESVRLEPDNAYGRNALGNALSAQKQLDEAIVHYREALRLEPELAEAHSNLGVTLQALGELDAAVRHYRQALHVRPRYAQALNNLGIALSAQGQLDEAIRRYREVLAIQPDSAEAHNNLGAALQSLDKLDEAIAHHRQAVRLDPTYAEAHNNLGIALGSRGAVEEAIEHYRQALQMRPDYAEAHNNLGDALLRRGDVEAAIGSFRQAVQIRSDYALAHTNLGTALTVTGRLELALEYFRRAVRLNPDGPAALTGLAWILAVHPDPNVRQPEHAIQHAQRAAELTSHHNAVVLDTLAAAYAAAGRFERAVATADSALGLASSAAAGDLVDQIRQRRELYKARRPYRVAVGASDGGRRQE